MRARAGGDPLIPELWPAIDIRDGRCVRLVQGDFAAETSYGDPEQVAAGFLDAGAERLHVVDLDAARTGQPVNREAIVRIARETGVPVQAGGGVRSLEAAAALLSRGVQRVVLGTAAVEQPQMLRELSARWPGRVVVGLDHRRETGGEGGARREIAIRGWSKGGGVALEAALQALAGLELAGVVVTDISRDGTRLGPDIDGLALALASTTLPVIASGGVGSAADLSALGALSTGGRQLAGVIVGTALLGGSIGIADAVVALGKCAPSG